MHQQKPPAESEVTADDRRTAPRIECLLEIAVTGHNPNYVHANVLDLSVGGVKLEFEHPPSSTEDLSLTFLTSGGLLFRVRATVVHLDEARGGRWIAGCRFVRELEDWEIAKLL